MKGTDIRNRLYELGRKPNKRYGQHFLVDQSVLNAILEAGEVHESDRVLEVGSGLGVLTEALIGRGAKVVAIEKDRALVAELRERLGDRAEIIEGDALKVNWTQDTERVAEGNGAAHRLPVRQAGVLPACPAGRRSASFKLIANIPYSITAEIIRKALWSKETPSVVVLLIQKEVAERAVQGTGHGAWGTGRRGTPRAPGVPRASEEKPSLLSLSVALASKSARIVRKVPPKCFYPAPSVDSAVLKIEPMTKEERLARWGVDPEKVLALAARAFANPRKKLTTTLAGNGISKGRLVEALLAAQASPDARPEELSAEQWAGMIAFLRPSPGPSLGREGSSA